MKQILTGLMAAAVLVTFSAPSFAMMDQKKKEESKGGHLFGEKKEEKGK